MHLVDEANVDHYGYKETLWEGIGLIDFMPVPHFDTPNHPESHLMYDVIKYLQKNNLSFQTLKDGEVITISDKIKAL